MTSGKVVTTVGYERRNNPLLAAGDIETFAERMLHDQPPRPANMTNIVAINQGRRPYTWNEPAVELVDAARFGELEAGRAVIDTRDGEAFARGHVPGSLSIPLASAAFEQNVGWLVEQDQELLLLAADAGAAGDALCRLAFVGLDSRVRGVLDTPAAERAGLLTRSLAAIDVERLHEEVAAWRVLDVRREEEWRSGHVAEARNLLFTRLPGELDRLGLGRSDPVAVVCEGGMRSSTACSVLLRRGFERVRNVTGGMAAWRGAGLPVRRG